MYTQLSSSHQPVTSHWNRPQMGAASPNHGKHRILYTVSCIPSALEASIFCPALPRMPRVRDTRPTHSGRFGKTKLSHKAHWAGRRLRGVPGMPFTSDLEVTRCFLSFTFFFFIHSFSRSCIDSFHPAPEDRRCVTPSHRTDRRACEFLFVLFKGLLFLAMPRDRIFRGI